MITIELKQVNEFHHAIAKVEPVKWIDSQGTAHAVVWWKLEGLGTSRNSGKAYAYALQDLAEKIIKMESK